MKRWMRSVVASACCLLAAQAALAATASVAVSSSGVVTVSPSPLQLAPDDDTAIFQMSSRGHVIVSAALAGFACQVDGGGQRAVCRKSQRSAKGDIQVRLTVRTAGGEPLDEPDIWVTNN